jgi:hypothetical protein
MLWKYPSQFQIVHFVTVFITPICVQQHDALVLRSLIIILCGTFANRMQPIKFGEERKYQLHRTRKLEGQGKGTER